MEVFRIDFPKLSRKDLDRSHAVSIATIAHSLKITDLMNIFSSYCSWVVITQREPSVMKSTCSNNNTEGPFFIHFKATKYSTFSQWAKSPKKKEL